uniref:Uncharacterized protein n=1 Tax=Parascaris equorum TaxID=6256 RepID=A0A914RG58_PAREQ
MYSFKHFDLSTSNRTLEPYETITHNRSLTISSFKYF